MAVEALARRCRAVHSSELRRRIPPSLRLWITSSQDRAADYRHSMDDNDAWMGTPNCPVCLIRMWPAGSDEKPYWYCPTCKLPRIV
jgi:hypothetical protein